SAGVSEECLTVFEELKARKQKYVIYKLQNYTEVVVDQAGTDPSYKKFVEILDGIQDNGKPVPRYAVYDFEYALASGEGNRSKIAFIAWNPDNAKIKDKTTYASSRSALVNALNGVSEVVQATDLDELAWDEVVGKVSGG
ncbi:actin depolymerizing factor 1, partial [Xylona heveae TC161]